MTNYADSSIAVQAKRGSLKNTASLGWGTKLVRGRLFKMLQKIEHGYLHISDRDGHYGFGDQDTTDEHKAMIEVYDPGFYTAVAFRGSVGAGEAYMNGQWTCDDLTAVVRLFARNRHLLRALERGLARAASPMYRAYHRWRRNTRQGSRRNISEHYDLGNEFFSLFLDETMMYSCAMFDSGCRSLKEASIAKIERICRQLRLSSSDHLMEIGTGWGGFALHAAGNYGCRITTTTVSEKQFKLARRRVEEAGLSNRVTVLLRDYRDLEGAYDKLVSIEMIEAVGDEFLDLYFRQCCRLLKPRGRMLIQAITIAPELYEESRRSVDFIQRYIFPGSSLPSVASICDSVQRVTNLRLINLDELTEHYPLTLHKWRERFLDNLDKIRELGHSDRFIRAWEFYFSYCEAGFMEHHIGDFQLLFEKPKF